MRQPAQEGCSHDSQAEYSAQLSAVDAGSAGQGTASVTLSNAADVASDVPGPTVMFVVNTQSSNPDNDAEATYAFTHYQLPLVEQAREGERA